MRFRRAVLAYLNEIAPGGFRDWTARFLEMADIDEAVPWDDAALLALVEADIAEGLRREVAKTPSVFLGDVTFVEWVPMPELLAALDEALGKAREVSA